MIAKSRNRTWKPGLKPLQLLVFTGESNPSRVSEVVRNGFRDHPQYPGWFHFGELMSGFYRLQLI